MATGALTDGSGSIAAGGASQEVFGQNSRRRYFFFQNISDEDMWLNFGEDAAADSSSIKVAASGGGFVMEDAFVSNEAINVVGATTGKKFVAKEG